MLPAASAASLAAGAVWEALGTSVVLRVTDGAALEQARALLQAELETIDAVASRFRADSELERVNDLAGSLTPISERLAEALEVALRAARLTGGLLDPTIGAALISAGYDRDRRLLAPAPQPAEGDQPSPPAAFTQAHGWRDVRIVRELGNVSAAVWIPVGVRIDLGATAKAFAADRAACAIAELTGSGALVSLGGDIATAGPPPAEGWQVHVTDDHRAGIDAPGQTVAIHAGALATSSTTTLRWSHDGRVMHHIIDPRTGQPATGPWRTVSVTAADCVDANSASTAAILLAETAPQWLADHGLAARLVAHDGAVTNVGGWPLESCC